MHVVPSARFEEQSFRAPLVMAPDASQEFAEHVAAVANSERTTRNIREVDEDERVRERTRIFAEEGGQERPIFFSTNRSPILDLKYLCRANKGSNTPMRPHDRH